MFFLTKTKRKIRDRVAFSLGKASTRLPDRRNHVFPRSLRPLRAVTGNIRHLTKLDSAFKNHILPSMSSSF